MNNLQDSEHETTANKFSLATIFTIFFAAIGMINMFIGMSFAAMVDNPPIELGYMVLIGLICLIISGVSASFEN